MKTPETAVTSIRIPRSWIPILDKIAAQRDTTRSLIIRTYIQDGINRYLDAKSIVEKAQEAGIIEGS